METRSVFVSFLISSPRLVSTPAASDVTSEDSLVTLNVYDRVSDHHFLGNVQIKPLLVHDHTVDQWYKCVVPFLIIASPHPYLFRLLPLENELVTGEMRVQTTFEQAKVRRACLFHA